MEALNNFEIGILEWIQNNMRCGFLDAVMPPITHLCKFGLFWIILAAIFLFFKKTRKTGIMMGAALVIGLLLCNCVLKPAVHRVRPYDISGFTDFLIKPEHDFSFPSGHAIAAFEGAVVIFIRNKKWGIPALILAFLIAFSRVYLYMHYPTDVVVSVILGSLIAVLGVMIVNFVDRKYLKGKLEAK